MYNFFPEISIMKTKKLNTKPKSTLDKTSVFRDLLFVRHD